MEEVDNEMLADPLLLASIQKIEHYCIAAWGTTAAMGRLLRQDKVVKTMEQVLNQGKRFDEQMTELAVQELNPRMLDGGEQASRKSKSSEAKSNQLKSNGSKNNRSKTNARGKSR